MDLRYCSAMKRLAAIAAAAALLACSDIHFETQATYRAPAGRFDLSIHVIGVVPAGHDLASQSTADVHVAPLAGGRPIDLRVSLPKPADGVDVAARIREAGYEAPPAELDEVNRVVDLALRGSKATLVKGQTRALEVVDVRFSYR